MQQLLQTDRYLFRLINSEWHNSFLDATLPLIRNQYLWFPFYLFMALFVMVNFKKNAFLWIIFVAALATLTDFVSSDLIKENVFRLRPCNDPEMANNLRFLVGYRPQSSSFTSSHATNHFGMATFFYFTLKKKIGNRAWGFFAWAFIIIYAQVYVGVHYPLDVIAGALVGFLFGYLPARAFNKNFPLQNR